MPTGLEVAVGQALIAGGASFATASAIITAAPALIAGAALITTSVVLSERARAAYNSASGGVNEVGLKEALPHASPEHRLALGTAAWAGAPFFYRGGEDYRPYFTVGLLLAAHECDGLVAVWINGTKVLIDPVTRLATSVPFNDGAKSYIEVSFRAGTLDQAIDPIIAAYHPEKASTFRQLGHCTVVIRADFGDGANYEAKQEAHKTLYGDGRFAPVIEFRGAKMADPRGLNQDVDDASTYQWSDNASLCTTHALRWFWPDVRIDWGLTAAAADIDDEGLITKSLEQIRQHTIDGIIRSGEEAANVIPSLLSANGGQLLRSEGKLYVMPAQVKKPVGTLSRHNLRGPFTYQPERRLGETANEFRPEFFSGPPHFNVTPGPVLRDQADVDADGAERPATLKQPFTKLNARSQRLAVRQKKHERIPATFSGGVDMTGVGWRAGQVINLDLAEHDPGLTGTWEIVEKPIDLRRGRYGLSLKRYDAAAEDYDAQTEELPYEEAA